MERKFSDDTGAVPIGVRAEVVGDDGIFAGAERPLEQRHQKARPILARRAMNENRTLARGCYRVDRVAEDLGGFGHVAAVGRDHVLA